MITYGGYYEYTVVSGSHDQSHQKRRDDFHKTSSKTRFELSSVSAYSAENKKGPAPAGKAIFWEGQNTSKETQSEVGNSAGGEES